MLNSIREINIADAKAFDARINTSEYYDSLSWSTLNTWDREGHARFFVINDDTVISMSRDLADMHYEYWAILSEPPDLAQTLERLYRGENDVTTTDIDWQHITFSLVGQAAATALVHTDEATSAYHIAPNPDSSEYIYDTPDLLAPSGKRMRRYKYNLLLFNRLFSDTDVQIEQVDDDPVKIHTLLETVRAWHTDGNTSGNDKVGAEYVALEHLFEQPVGEDTHVYKITIDGTTAAFSVTRYLPAAHMLVIPHLKCNYAYQGIFDKSLQLTLEAATQTQAFSEVNLSSDMGIEGLRQHKLRLRPIRMQQIYTVMPASGVNQQN